MHRLSKLFRSKKSQVCFSWLEEVNRRPQPMQVGAHTTSERYLVIAASNVSRPSSTVIFESSA